jgi:hypothetical protein
MREKYRYKERADRQPNNPNRRNPFKNQREITVDEVAQVQGSTQLQIAARLVTKTLTAQNASITIRP